jgi:hypothetical protein
VEGIYGLAGLCPAKPWTFQSSLITLCATIKTVSERELWNYFREVRQAVNRGNRGDTPHPYRRGDFMVCAQAGDIELTVQDVSEEDAVLIASELKALGAHAVVSGSRLCNSCKERVPAQSYCTNCRAKLP